MNRPSITQLAFVFSTVTQIICIVFGRGVSSLARQAYAVIIPGLSLPRFTELVLRYHLLEVLGYLGILSLISLFLYRKRSTGVTLYCIVGLLSCECVAILAASWAYLLPFGYMIGAQR